VTAYPSSRLFLDSLDLQTYLPADTPCNLLFLQFGIVSEPFQQDFDRSEAQLDTSCQTTCRASQQKQHCTKLEIHQKANRICASHPYEQHSR
jgi:hypothetical protein